MTKLEVLRDLMLGGSHSRLTVGRHVSLPTADRWLKELCRVVPGVVKVRHGKYSWFEWRGSLKKDHASAPPSPLPSKKKR